MADDTPPLDDLQAAFARARRLLGKWVVVTLDKPDGGEEVIAEGDLLRIDEWGEVAVRDEMGGVHYCWPMLDIRKAPRPTQGGE